MGKGKKMCGKNMGPDRLADGRLSAFQISSTFRRPALTGFSISAFQIFSIWG
jgi:hypothetical protein